MKRLRHRQGITPIDSIGVFESADGLTIKASV